MSSDKEKNWVREALSQDINFSEAATKMSELACEALKIVNNKHVPAGYLNPSGRASIQVGRDHVAFLKAKNEVVDRHVDYAQKLDKHAKTILALHEKAGEFGQASEVVKLTASSDVARNALVELARALLKFISTKRFGEYTEKQLECYDQAAELLEKLAPPAQKNNRADIYGNEPHP